MVLELEEVASCAVMPDVCDYAILIGVVDILACYI
jgi:hypothetical protein